MTKDEKTINSALRQKSLRGGLSDLGGNTASDVTYLTNRTGTLRHKRAMTKARRLSCCLGFGVSFGTARTAKLSPGWEAAAALIVAGGWAVFIHFASHHDRSAAPSMVTTITQSGPGIASGHDTVVNAPVNIGGRLMAWTTPTLVEICIGLEINGYLPAEF